MRHLVTPFVAVMLVPTVQPSLPEGSLFADAVTQQLELWRAIKTELQRPNGESYWSSSIKDAFIPGGANGVDTLRGTVVSSKPTEHPSEIVLAISDDHTAEVTLKLVDEKGNVTGLKEPVPSGTTVAFGGIAKMFTREPFMVTFQVELVLDQEDRLSIFDKRPKQFELNPK